MLRLRRSANVLDSGPLSRRTLARLLQGAHGITGFDHRGPTPSAGCLQAVELYLADGELVKRRYWRLCAVGRRDTIAIEKSNVFVSIFGDGAKEFCRVTSKDPVKPELIKFWRAKTRKIAIWYEYKLNHGEKVMSEKLADHILCSNLSGWYFNDFEHYDEVSVDFSSSHEPKYIHPQMIRNA